MPLTIAELEPVARLNFEPDYLSVSVGTPNRSWYVVTCARTSSATDSTR
jgi:hypothetical protein